ncbi:hypothetical protein [Methylobacterium sp. GC_Met_2]|uniref:hypothetical protein n=1 Tax=Methylobacterium sp. GC_Met_2 TaxID=2937376 RepID=UPI00226B039D|nr:hypothetical protein [Methylobacterium sp. GC_Met_2]
MSTNLPDYEQRRTLIAKAFCNTLKLDDSPETQLRVSLAAEALSRMVDPKLTYPNAFKDLGGTKVKKELQRFATQVRALRSTLHSFHRATIVRLADTHIMRSDLEEVLYNIEGAFGPLEDIAERMGAIETSDIAAPTRGKSTRRARAISSQVALQYKIVLGKDPSITTNPTDNSKSGKFIDLLSAVFKILFVEGSAIQRAEETAERLKAWRDRQAAKSPNPPFEGA